MHRHQQGLLTMHRLVALAALCCVVLLFWISASVFGLLGSGSSLFTLAAGASAGSGAGGLGGAVGCDPSLNLPTGGNTAWRALSVVQRHRVASIVSVGQRMSIPVRGQVIALAVARTESNYQLYANDGSWTGGGVSAKALRAVKGSLQYRHDAVGHDHDSVNVFQQRPSAGWGSLAQLMDETYAARVFYQHLQKIAGWRDLPVTVAAQRVQGSAYPGAYAAHAEEAASLVALLGDVNDASGCQSTDVPVSGRAGVVVAAARKWVGAPYAWAGGTPMGPSRGVCDAGNGAPNDCHVIGFDCSGLTLYAYARAGVRLDHSASAQYAADGGTPIPINQAQAGDLVFYATDPGVPASIHHVAIYLGGNRMIEAPESGSRVHVTALRRGGELMPHAIRYPH
jgi:cell wall-associated NlpC family hydrolase